VEYDGAVYAALYTFAVLIRLVWTTYGIIATRKAWREWRLNKRAYVRGKHLTDGKKIIRTQRLSRSRNFFLGFATATLTGVVATVSFFVFPPKVESSAVSIVTSCILISMIHFFYRAKMADIQMRIDANRFRQGLSMEEQENMEHRVGKEMISGPESVAGMQGFGEEYRDNGNDVEKEEEEQMP
jgi:hypothetical protein